MKQPFFWTSMGELKYPTGAKPSAASISIPKSVFARLNRPSIIFGKEKNGRSSSCRIVTKTQFHHKKSINTHSTIPMELYVYMCAQTHLCYVYRYPDTCKIQLQFFNYRKRISMIRFLCVCVQTYLHAKYPTVFKGKVENSPSFAGLSLCSLGFFNFIILLPCSNNFINQAPLSNFPQVI